MSTVRYRLVVTHEANARAAMYAPADLFDAELSRTGTCFTAYGAMNLGNGLTEVDNTISDYMPDEYRTCMGNLDRTLAFINTKLANKKEAKKAFELGLAKLKELADKASLTTVPGVLWDIQDTAESLYYHRERYRAKPFKTVQDLVIQENSICEFDVEFNGITIVYMSNAEEQNDLNHIYLVYGTVEDR